MAKKGTSVKPAENDVSAPARPAKAPPPAHRACPMMVMYNAYRIVRQDGGDLRAGRALYYVQRPDGTECCRETSWRMVERVIRRDMRANHWPADSLPPELAAEINTGPNTPSPPAPAAKAGGARARPAARLR